MLTIGTQKSDRLFDASGTWSGNPTMFHSHVDLKSDKPEGLAAQRVTEIVNSCFGKSVLEVEKYFDADI